MALTFGVCTVCVRTNGEIFPGELIGADGDGEAIGDWIINGDACGKVIDVDVIVDVGAVSGPPFILDASCRNFFLRMKPKFKKSKVCFF